MWLIHLIGKIHYMYLEIKKIPKGSIRNKSLNEKIIAVLL